MHRPSRGGRRQGVCRPDPPYSAAPVQIPNSGFPYFQRLYSQHYWNLPPVATAPASGVPQLSPFSQNPSILHHQAPPYVQNPLPYRPQAVNPCGKSQQDLLGRAEAALEKAHCELLAAGESVSAWKVSQSALVSLQVDSWASLGFQFQDIPYLRHLVTTEGKVNAFIHCFVGVWRITSLHDLDAAICKNEGIEQFDALRLGPLLQHPLVFHYFSIPPDTTEVPKITADEIICCLSSYVDKFKKVVVPEEFLSFLMERYSVSTKEKLGVRIQSLGLHLTYIRDAKKAEKIALSSFTKGLENSASSKREIEGIQSTQPPNMFSEKKVLDRRFGFISKRIKSFSSACDVFEGKHIKFDSSGEDDSGSDSKSHYQSSPRADRVIQQRVSSCPYPSTTEEIKRLGLKTETDVRTSYTGKTKHDKSKKSGRKRKYEAQNLNGHSLNPVLQEDLDRNETEKKKYDITFNRSMMHEFVTRWKEACRKHTAVEVLDMMANFYVLPPKSKKKSKRIFSLYPGIGLLNVAIASIKYGMLDTVYDSQNVEPEFGDSTPASSEDIGIELPVKKDALSIKTICAHKLESRVTVDDIIKKITSYFEGDYLRTNRDPPVENTISILRRFNDCELWLAREFSVDVFCSLGCGHFVDFLERNLDRIPVEVSRHFVRDSSRTLLVVNLKQLKAFLSQAQDNVVDLGGVTQRYILMLLEKQFPTLCFDFISDEIDSRFQDLIRRQKTTGTPNRVYYSTALLGKFFIEKSNICNGRYSPEAMGMNIDVDRDADCNDTVSAKDAIECLLKVPMLSDLQSWSHWDLVFAPKLGPLLAWLSKEVHNDEISCIALSDGRLIRIDHSANVDEFLEASIRCSPFHAALKLLSLLALYGGTNNIPVALLKCYSQRAMDVIIRNCMECQEISNPASRFLCGSSFNCQIATRSDSDAISFSADTVGLTLNSGVNVAARFVLDCLNHIPSEFHSFAVEILMSGLRSSAKDGPLIMLRECKRTEQRIMLHDIGLSLGIVEWIEDYHLFKSATSAESLSSSQDSSKNLKSVLTACNEDMKGTSAMNTTEMLSSNTIDIIKSDVNTNAFADLQISKFPCERSDNKSGNENEIVESRDRLIQNAALVIESIRREEFGLDPSSSCTESSLLKKQHARLGRALYCLSQELYSQDSHLLLELVQNADDNTYSENVEPALVFILHPTGIVILNNERGFSAENIRALCDIGNSTKKGSSAGYIGQKGIGFKSVFRITDAPEIHSNGFHVKFDISEGQIGFVLPTVISPCDIRLFERQLSSEIDQDDASCWNTCIVLPFRSKLKERSGINSIMSMFSDLHPSLLLFLHRLECIKFKNILDDSLIIMRKEPLGDGIVKVSYGKEKMNWLVVRRKLQASVVRPGVQMTEIAVAFTLQESDTGEYVPYLSQQPAFAFLPLRTYGLKFILQGDFVLPSSREEVDGNSAWNQWLLSEFPTLFVNAETSFTALSCFKKCPGKAVSAFMSFVPLVGEVHGFFAYLPQMIVSKLRSSSCLLLEGHGMEWVPPCNVLRGWDERARKLLSDNLLQRHLGLGFLDGNIALSDSLAKTLGIREYGPQVLIDILSSICHNRNEIQQLGFGWLSDWLLALSSTLSQNSSEYLTLNAGMESDVISDLRRIPFIPLSDGTYGSTTDGPIWLPGDSFGVEIENKRNHHFPCLYAKLRTVNLGFLSLLHDNTEELRTDVIFRLLHRIGVQELSAHEVIISHILPDISAAKYSNEDKNLMVEYLSYVMLHFQNACSSCQIQRMGIVSALQKCSIILTNHGYKCPVKEPLHFSQEFGNPFEINKLIEPKDDEWNEVDDIYLKHYSTESTSSLLIKWRKFFQELGVSDFVQVIRVEKHVKDLASIVPGSNPYDLGNVSPESQIIDWESPELVRLLSTYSSGKQREKCRYLLEVLDKSWDEAFGSGTRNYVRVKSIDCRLPHRSSFLKCLHDFRWIGSTADEELHYPKDLFYDCDAVRSTLGSFAPYAVPQVKSRSLLDEIGFKTQVTHEDALVVIQFCGTLQGPALASTVQMSNLYNFIWEGVTSLKLNIMDQFKSHPLIFVPSSRKSRYTDTALSGTFLSSNQVYWHDPTGCLDQVEKAMLCSALADNISGQNSKTLIRIYPNLHDFFVNECGVPETPPFGNYIEILLQLSSVTLPSQAAHLVFQVFIKWSDDIKSGRIENEEIVLLRESLRKVENMVLPTMQNRWVSLHPSFGIVCWSDNEELREQFKHSDNVNFIQFGELSNDDMEILSGKLSTLLQKLGIVALSEIISREAIFYGSEDSREKVSFVNWALPYAQRYLFKLYPDRYIALKKLGAERLPLLQIVVVEKLFYRYTIKGSDGTSRKRSECSCLLQDNVLYMTRASDSHSIFLELSRIFFNGSAELHFANFLHMIATMAESGSTEGQTEFFIVNSQKVPALPVEEPVWSISTVVSLFQGSNTHKSCPPLVNTERSNPSLSRKAGIAANWPPTDWKTAPDFSRASHFGANPGPAPCDSLTIEPSRPLEAVRSEDISSLIEVHGDWVIEDSARSEDLTLHHAGNAFTPSDSVALVGSIDGQSKSRLEPKIGTGDPVPGNGPNVNSDDISLGSVGLSDNQSRRTGVLGEAVAYKYFSEKFSSVSVKWVNQDGETGLPYDLVIEDKGHREFVEVKATRSATKDWFPITTREWQFAAEKGDSYSIAHISFVGPKNVRVTVLKNPLRLCQQNVLCLALLMRKQ